MCRDMSREMTWWVNAPAAQQDNLNFILRNHIEMEKTDSTDFPMTSTPGL